MKQFDKYAKCYDLLYSDKDYKEEANFIDKIIRKYGVERGSLLELGCGTGMHAIQLAALGWDVLGVDISRQMIDRAKKKMNNTANSKNRKVEFETGDVRYIKTGSTYDVVVSLFHVISYQTSNEDLILHIKTAASHLKKGGLFIFDFWYGPAVLTDPPRVRIKRVNDDENEVTRIAQPRLLSESNTVEVTYEINILDLVTMKNDRIVEKHTMRYLFLPEINMVLNESGLKLVETCVWMSSDPVTERSWYVYGVGYKR